MGKTIGTGYENDGLFFLNTRPQFVLCNVSTSDSLWNQRVGHPSHRVSSLHPIFKNKNVVENTCLICPLAKQTLNLFLLHTTTSSSCFDLIHMDIWGGYHVPCLSRAHYFLTIMDDHSKFTWIYRQS
ncbi:LOW QUALITY PROTEIN: hypothetical protein V2J09_004560 [Rumex salicifolius]